VSARDEVRRLANEPLATLRLEPGIRGPEHLAAPGFDDLAVREQDALGVPGEHAVHLPARGRAVPDQQPLDERRPRAPIADQARYEARREGGVPSQVEEGVGADQRPARGVERVGSSGTVFEVL
jgi:hypothetical protein